MSFGASTATIVSAMNKLATDASTKTVCSVKTLANKTDPGGTDVHMIEIKPTGAAADRPVALILGGVHARELAPPAAVFSFARKLIEAYAAKTDVSYPALTDGAVTYPAWKIKQADVKKVVDRYTIQLVPVVNPDGRDFVLAGNAMWRCNRNLAACAQFGVDLNRNFNIGWHTDKYYTAADETKILQIAISATCTDDAFRGPSAGSENETKNIQKLIDDGDVRLFVDVHSHGRRVLTSWGLAENQSKDPAQNFLDTKLDRKPAQGPQPAVPGRSVLDGKYKEFLPDAKPHRVFEVHVQLAKKMTQAILDQAGKGATAIKRSTYLPKQIPQLYQEQFKLPHIVPVPGSSADYALSRQFKPAEPKPAYAFALEIGYKPTGKDPKEDPETEGGFAPTSATKFEKIERETHAALFAFLQHAPKP
jgi:hypothetical protein